MAIYRGTGGFSNVTGTAEIEYVTEKSVEIQNAVAEVEQLAAEITSNTSAAQAAADTAVAASNGVQGFAAIASDKALEAQVSATNAQTNANTATTQALAASTSATNAANSANAANTSALSAATSEFNAELSATTATTKASEASTSASNAASSASSASTSANTATTAASTATTKASEASASAAAAAQSAIDAAQFDPSSYYTESEVDTLLAAKQATLVSGTNIKTVNGASILGSGNITTPTTTVNNTLTSISTTEALSAAQGKVLQDGKQATLVSGTNIKTVNGTSVLGSGNIAISAGMTNAVYDLTGNITLAANVNRNIVINSSTAEYNITLPDATQVAANGGVMFNFNNTSTNIVRVLDNSGSIVFALEKGESISIVAINVGTSKGVWKNLSGYLFNKTSKNATLIQSTPQNQVYYVATEVLSPNKFLVIYVKSSQTWCVVVSISSAGIVSIGAETNIQTSVLIYISTCQISTDKIALSYNLGSNVVRVISVSGTTPTIGTALGIGGNTFTNLCSISTDKFAGVVTQSSQQLYLATVSGTTISIQSYLTLAAAASGVFTLSSISSSSFLALYNNSVYKIAVSGNSMSILGQATKSTFFASDLIDSVVVGDTFVAIGGRQSSIENGTAAGLYFVFYDVSQNIPLNIGSIEFFDAMPASNIPYSCRISAIDNNYCIALVSSYNLNYRMYLIDVKNKNVTLIGSPGCQSVYPPLTASFLNGVGIITSEAASSTLVVTAYKGFE
jgi:hypothetical protein